MTNVKPCLVILTQGNKILKRSIKKTRGKVKIAFRQTKLHCLSCQQQEEQEALSCQAPKNILVRISHMHLELQKLQNE